MNKIELLKRLYATQQKFYIRVHMDCSYNREFVKDCRSKIGFIVDSIYPEHNDITIRFADKSNTSNGGPIWNMGLRCFARTGNDELIIQCDSDPIVSNKGKTNCLCCGCKTNMRRDFNDFSIREFCPRCKI